MAEALNSETFETVATPKIKAKIEDEKVLKKLFKELKLKSPSEELLKRFPYIRKNPCIRRIMVAVHELQYKLTKLSVCGCTDCTFCKYHVEMMLEEKYDDPPTTPDTTIYYTPNATPVKNMGTTSVKAPDTTQTMTKDKSPQAATPACKAVNVVFLLYCINCDEVLLGFTSEKLEFFADLSFGFHRDEKCERGKSHEKKYVRCMMIDETNQEKSSEDENNPNKSSEDENNPNKSSEDENNPNKSSEDENNPNKSSEDENNPNKSSEDENNPNKSSEDENNPNKSSEDENNPNKSSEDENNPNKSSEDENNPNKSSEDETKRNEILSCIQNQNNDQVLIGILKNREVCHFSSIQKDTLSDDVNNTLSVWDTYLQTNKKYLIVKKYNESYKEEEEKYSSTPIPELDNWGLYRCYHHIPISNIKGLGTRARTFSYKSETIVYLKICYNCNIKYVGKTDKSILVRYRKALSSECTTSVEQHFDGEHECTFRDYRWTVMDALSDDQIYLLDKWRYVFNRCELDVQKKIWEQMNCDVNSVNKDLLEIVWQKNSIGEIIERIKEIEPIKEMELIKAMELLIPSSQNDTMNELDRKLEHSNSSNDDVETFLRNENEKWIEKTKALYLEEWGEYWMTELQTRENGLNVINSSKCKDTCPHFYIEFFKSLPNNDVEIPITDNVI